MLLEQISGTSLKDVLLTFALPWEVWRIELECKNRGYLFVIPKSTVVRIFFFFKKFHPIRLLPNLNISQ
jgi:hypothetical protein